MERLVKSKKCTDQIGVLAVHFFSKGKGMEKV